MTTKGIPLFLAIVFGFVLPCVALSFLKEEIPHQNLKTEQVYAVPEEKRMVRVKMVSSVMDMEEEEYILGVLLQEMPVSFEMEALKAQAVVARTYTRRRQLVAPKHDGADVCTDPACCQGYCPPEKYEQKGIDKAALEKVRNAVIQTGNLVLTYNGELIDATYFSCSGGMTEDAAAVWGTDIPYLQATESPGEEMAAGFMETVQFSLQEFQDALGVKLAGNVNSWIKSMTLTSGGGVETISVGGKIFSGTEIRKRLSLRSSCFTMTVLGDTVTVTTKGFGHRVGMSQYGAEAMAVNGSDFKAILGHYYKDSKLEEVG